MKRSAALFAALLYLCLACTDDDTPNDAVDTTLQDAVSHYADLVYANYEDAHADAVALNETIDAFVASPSAAGLTEAKEAWLAARESYGQTEAFRFYGGPIDDEDGPEGQLNAWPLDESYIDYVNGTTSGDETPDGTNIINSPTEFPEITPEVIASLNENGSETNISSGYHAIEFLLWGQDLSVGPGGGERPYTDYVTDGSGTNDNQERRATYLQAATQLVIDDLESLMDEWEAGSGAYRATFTSEEEAENSLSKIVSALGKLSKGELAGERMFVAWDLRSKEDEHSCFSDNTHRDIVNNALGIQNVYLGRYVRTDGSTLSGTSIYDVLALEDADLAEEIKTLMEESVEACEAIEAPFDQEFLAEPGRTRIQEAFTLLRTQGDKLAEAANVLGFSFDPDDI
uniref:Imelysin family protein n=1 Tax=Roseihalotalea indica TaxID=2867963 RepID=A0AA49JD28_9BACT|nr:imelysin family protein [Tunicatimonas sp. TK19036]